jgi:hypothetical protein
MEGWNDEMDSDLPGPLGGEALAFLGESTPFLGVTLGEVMVKRGDHN